MTDGASQRDGELAEHTRLLEELDGLLPHLPSDERDSVWDHAEKGVSHAKQAIDRATAAIAEGNSR